MENKTWYTSKELIEKYELELLKKWVSQNKTKNNAVTQILLKLAKQHIMNGTQQENR